jgi:hypothetical protein
MVALSRSGCAETVDDFASHVYGSAWLWLEAQPGACPELAGRVAAAVERAAREALSGELAPPAPGTMKPTTRRIMTALLFARDTFNGTRAERAAHLRRCRAIRGGRASLRDIYLSGSVALSEWAARHGKPLPVV